MPFYHRCDTTACSNEVLKRMSEERWSDGIDTTLKIVADVSGLMKEVSTCGNRMTDVLTCLRSEVRKAFDSLLAERACVIVKILDRSKTHGVV